jgi:Ger(x)C family germination protein
MKRILLIIIIISMLLTTGCWDMVEVDQRIYPYSVSYDLIDENKGLYNITISYPNLGALGKNPISEEKVNVISTEAYNIFDAMHKLSTKIEYVFYLNHLKVLALNENVATNEKHMRQILDGIYRDFVANKNVQMILVREDGKNVLTTAVKTRGLSSVEGTLNTLLQNIQSSTMFSPKTVANFIFDTDISGASIIPIAMTDEDEIAIEGGAVFKNYKLIGYIDGMTNRNIAYLTNRVDKDGFRTVYKGSDLTLMITNIHSKPKLISSSNNNIKVRMDVKIEGHIHSYVIGDDTHIDKKEIIEDIQNQVAKEYEEDFKKTIALIQKQYKVDILKIGDHLRKFEPKVWKRVKDNWDEIYPEIDIELDVKVYIRRRGLTK